MNCPSGMRPCLYGQPARTIISLAMEDGHVLARGQLIYLRPQSLRGRRLDDRTVLEGLGGRKLDDDRTILERLDADHVRLLAESAELKDSMQRVVNERRKATEPRAGVARGQAE